MTLWRTWLLPLDQWSGIAPSMLLRVHDGRRPGMLLALHRWSCTASRLMIAPSMLLRVHDGRRPGNIPCMWSCTASRLMLDALLDFDVGPGTASSMLLRVHDGRRPGMLLRLYRWSCTALLDFNVGPGTTATSSSMGWNSESILMSKILKKSGCKRCNRYASVRKRLLHLLRILLHRVRWRPGRIRHFFFTMNEKKFAQPVHA